MDESFYSYLNMRHIQNEQYDIVRPFCIHASAYDGDEICFWDYDNQIHVSNEKAFLYRYFRVNKYNQKYSTNELLPEILYQTSDKSKMEIILSVLAISNYNSKIEALMDIVKPQKKLTLVDK